MKTCLTVRREKLQTDGCAPTFVVHEALGSGIARCSRSPLIGVPCKLVVCVLRKFRWYARTHRLKSERERETEIQKEGADRAHDTHVYTRKANSNDDGHVYSMRILYTSYTYTHCTLARPYLHIDSVAARMLAIALHARARSTRERERDGEEKKPGGEKERDA